MTTTSNLPPLSSNSPIKFGKTLFVQRLGHKKSILLTSLYRPRVKNAFNDDLYSDLVNLMNAAKDDESVHAIVLTGTGDYFSSGADISNVAVDSDSIDRPTGKFMLTLLSFPKVFVAAVNGPAVGIGVTLLLHCDLVYCTQKSTFWVPFSRIAFVPEFCSSVLLVETCGLNRANELLLMAKRIDAKKAVENRIVCGIVDDCDESGNPFAANSIGSKVCRDLDESLYKLCHGDRSAEIYVEMVRGRAARQERLEVICRDELRRLDERLRNGEVLEAAMQLKEAAMQKKKRSKM